jgi:hypothetical protein
MISPLLLLAQVAASKPDDLETAIAAVKAEGLGGLVRTLAGLVWADGFRTGVAVGGLAALAVVAAGLVAGLLLRSERR